MCSISHQLFDIHTIIRAWSTQNAPTFCSIISKRTFSSKEHVSSKLQTFKFKFATKNSCFVFYDSMLFIIYAGCIGCLCPCFLFGKNAEFLGSGTFLGSCVTHFILWSVVNTACCLLTDGLFWGLPGCLVSCYACGYRKALRSKYNLPVMLLQLCFALTLVHYFPSIFHFCCGIPNFWQFCSHSAWNSSFVFCYCTVAFQETS